MKGWVEDFPPLNLINYPMTNKTDEIFQLTAPYSNPYQGTDKKLLFVCSAGLLRSATAANLYAKKGFNTRSAGSHDYALVPVSMNLLKWADVIYFVNKENWQTTMFRFADKIDLDALSINVLDIPDKYSYNHPELIKSLEDQIGDV